MSENEIETPSEPEVETEEQASTASAETAEAEEQERLAQEVEIENAGPCRRHVRVRIPRADLERLQESVTEELVQSAAVPGFRKGHVPRKLVAKRFRQEITDELRQKILVQSLEQLSDENDLDPINEPNLDVAGIEIPEEGDFEYEFDVEVRPDFELPDYRGLQIERPSRDVSESDVDEYIELFLSQYSESSPHDGPAEPGHQATVSIRFTHGDRTLNEMHDLNLCLRPVLRFRDSELQGFDTLLAGAVVGDKRTAEMTISDEASSIEMRGEVVQAEFAVNAVKELKLPEMNHDFFQRVGVESEEELRLEISNILERQVAYRQRQTTRRQVLEKITESADWDLPESLVTKQVENAMHREILEMQQAGFTTRQIRARENELRQDAISTTRQAMKEHFVLDKIATTEDIAVTPSDIEAELQLMALQSGENPRRLRARLVKSGVIDNLEAQIRERKAVDFILEHAQFEDVEMERPVEADVEAVNQAICGSVTTTEATSATAEAESEETAPASDE